MKPGMRAKPMRLQMCDVPLKQSIRRRTLTKCVRHDTMSRRNNHLGHSFLHGGSMPTLVVMLTVANIQATTAVTQSSDESWSGPPLKR